VFGENRRNTPREENPQNQDLKQNGKRKKKGGASQRTAGTKEGYEEKIPQKKKDLVGKKKKLERPSKE